MARHSAGSAALSKPPPSRPPHQNGTTRLSRVAFLAATARACVCMCARALAGRRGLALDTRSEARRTVRGSVGWRDPDFPWSVTSFFCAAVTASHGGGGGRDYKAQWGPLGRGEKWRSGLGLSRQQRLTPAHFVPGVRPSCCRSADWLHRLEVSEAQ
ncbi:hypothetical protein MTO96_007821 [Rhipicephalus appendiculatus]